MADITETNNVDNPLSPPPNQDHPQGLALFAVIIGRRGM
jgi:hypothetical protein